MADGQKTPMGKKPFDWTPELEDDLLSRIMMGEAVMDICGPDRDDFTPSERTFYKHLSTDSEFAQKYARAREAQAHREFDETRKIANDAKPMDVAVARLQIDTIKWRASKMAPKVYGEKAVIDHTSSDGSMTPKQALTVPLNELTDEQREAVMAAYLPAAVTP